MGENKLKGRQKTFAERVAEGHTATEAYLLAGYRPVKRETAHRAASRLYANPAVRAYIRELRRTGDDLAREETTLTIARKLAFLARLVLTSSATIREDDPLIQSHRMLKDGSTSIRIPCKLKALKMHSELAGHFLPEPTEPPPPVDTLQLFFDQIRSGTTLEDHDSEPWVQSRDCKRTTAHRFSERKILAQGHPESSSTQELSFEREHQAPPSTPSAETAQPQTTSLPEASANPQPDPESKINPLPTTTNPPPSSQRPSAQPAPSPVCKLKTESPKTPPPPSPLTQARKAIIAQIQRSSPISHLHFAGTSPPPMTPPEYFGDNLCPKRKPIVIRDG